MSCKINKGMHTFHNTTAQPETKVGQNGVFAISTWHTCIACGERRGITQLGELVVKVIGKWSIKEPENAKNNI